MPADPFESASGVAGRRPRAWPRPAGRWAPGAVALAALALSALHLALDRGPLGPKALPDEMGYLAVARLLAGPESPVLGPHLIYFPGYGLLLAPLAALIESPEGLYRAGLVLNALLAGLLVVPLYLVARRMLGLSTAWAFGAAGAAALYPAYLVLSGFLLTEALVALLAATWTLLAFEMARSRSWRGAVAFGAVGGALLMTHPRSAGAALVTAIVLAALGLSRAIPRRAAALGLLALTAMLAATAGLLVATRSSVYVEGTGGAPLGGVRALASPAGWGELALIGAGQLWYLNAATLGVATLGAITLVGTARRGLRGGRPEAVAAVVALGGMAGSLVASSLVMAGPRVTSDQLVFGRYNEGFLAVLVVAGLGLVARRSRLAPRALGAAAAASLAVGLLLLAAHGSDGLDGRPRPVAIAGVMAWATWAGDRLPVLLIAGATAALMGGLAALVAGSPRAATAALACLFAASGILVQEREAAPFAEQRSSLVELADVAPWLGHVRRIAYDRRATSLPSHAQAIQFWLPRTRLVPFDAADGEAPADVVLTSLEWPEGSAEGARRLFASLLTLDALWVRPGPALEGLRAQGLDLPPPGAPLPATAYRAEIALEGSATRTIPAGGGATVRVRLRHAGAGAPWPAALGDVAVLAVWTPADRAGEVAAHQAVPLPRTVMPGGSLRLDLELSARAPRGGPLPPGAYTVAVRLVHAAAPGALADPVRTLDVQVTAPPG